MAIKSSRDKIPINKCPFRPLNTHSTEDILQSQEPFVSYTPSTPPMKQFIEDAVGDTTKYYDELKEIKTEVMALKSFVLEQFLIIKQKTKPTSEASQCSNCSDNRELINTLLDQTEFLRKEIFSKSNIVFNLLNMDNKNFNNIQNFSYKSMNDKNGDESYDNMPYEIPKRTVSSNGIKDDNTKPINFLSSNRLQHYLIMIHRILILLILLRHQTHFKERRTST